MIRAFEDYLERLQTVHAEIQKTIDGLPPEALDWTPGPETNSLSVLAVHVAGAERYWIGDVVGRDPSGRDRPAEFRVRGLDAATLTARLAEALSHSRTVVEGLTLSEMETERISPRDGRSVTVAWALFHALRHAAEHMGHMQLTRQLWDRQHV